MRIKEVAERTGFSPPTLRYYEDIGLLPASARTPAGYRTYDEHTVERLAFIARAKQLGCTLEEIADLIRVWDRGRCGPIQDRLRDLVAEKLVVARGQIIELSKLAGELQRVAATLDIHRPDGPCDDDCGCLSDGSASTASPIAVKTKPMEGDVPIACTLGPNAMHGQLVDWQVLLSHVARRSRREDGVRVEFGATVPLGELTRLVAAEQDCCQFLRFAITVDTRGVGLEVSGPDDAGAIIEAVFGAPE